MLLGGGPCPGGGRCGGPGGGILGGPGGGWTLFRAGGLQRGEVVNNSGFKSALCGYYLCHVNCDI